MWAWAWLQVKSKSLILMNRILCECKHGLLQCIGNATAAGTGRGPTNERLQGAAVYAGECVCVCVAYICRLHVAMEQNRLTHSTHQFTSMSKEATKAGRAGRDEATRFVQHLTFAMTL